MNEDLEREYMTDVMYQMERQKQIEQEYWEWEHRKPALIVVIKKEEHEHNIKSTRATI